MNSAFELDGVTIVAHGRLLRVASVKDEPFVLPTLLPEPSCLIDTVGRSTLRADVLTFAQAVGDCVPKFEYRFEWDNVAAVDTTDFERWWAALPQATRKNCRRAVRSGVSTRLVTVDEDLARGIKSIYDECPVRQGRRFWHYGKDLRTVLQENSSYLERSDVIGAYVGNDLVGFLKMVYVGPVAKIMQILARISAYDKRPMNALIAKAVETCSGRGSTHLIYSKFQYGNKVNDPLIEFKRRNGFTKLEFPRYYVPLTLKGRLALAGGLHRDVLSIIPPKPLESLLRLRRKINGFRFPNSVVKC